jgi:Fe-S-cluster formation regulator IscX/YfhJ
MNKEIERLNKRLENEAHKSAVLQDALECILEATDDDPRTIAEETLEAIAEYSNWEDQ